MTVADEIREVLAGLNGDGIAERLQAMGVTGRLGDTCECPIARFIRAVVPGARDRWRWGDDLGQFAVGIRRVYTPVGTVPLPPRVQRFVMDFDRERYGFLQDRGV